MCIMNSLRFTVASFPLTAPQQLAAARPPALLGLRELASAKRRRRGVA